MAFSNIWDTTFPPDTQLANLLGLDIRNGVKVDVQQRMAAISGLDAVKPNFAGDTQPTNWNGILFFATDTGQIYQFNNPVWTNITSSFILKSVAQKQTGVTVLTSPYTNSVVATFTINGNVMGNNGHLRITFMALVVGNMSFSLTFGGVAFAPNFSFGAGGFYKAQIEIYNLGATNSQSLYIDGNQGVGGGGWTGQTFAVDTTVNQTLQLLASTTSANGTIQRVTPVVVEAL
jgi:hypothetical protein